MPVFHFQYLESLIWNESCLLFLHQSKIAAIQQTPLIFSAWFLKMTLSVKSRLLFGVKINFFAFSAAPDAILPVRGLKHLPHNFLQRIFHNYNSIIFHNILPFLLHLLVSQCDLLNGEKNPERKNSILFIF